MKIMFTVFVLLPFLLLAQPELLDIGLGGVGSISKNGQFLCGSNYPYPPFVWSESTGRIEIGTDGGEAFSVSDNGIVVGRFLDSNLTVGGVPVLRAGYWANNQWNGFEGIPGVPPLDDHDFTHSYGINSNGTKAVGMVWHEDWHVEACYWSIPDTGIGLLGQTGNFNSRANVISNNGEIIAGWDGLDLGPDRRAFYWDPLPHFMGGFDPTYLVGECNGMNSDGSVIVGSSVWPFIWTEAAGMQQVVADSSQYWSGSALAVSDNGIIVGFVDPGGFAYQGFIKKPGWSDILYIEDFIRDSLGITALPDWYFAFASTISADGNRIGISAYPPGSGFSHAVLLTLDSTVPVELNAFTAAVNGNIVHLNWSTATEKNNSGFEIERKSAGREWEVLGFVQGKGTTTEPSVYNYIDNLNSPGIYEYRLKQIDFDGSFEYSGEVTANVSMPAQYSLTQNYPNPFNPSTNISFSLPQDQLVNLTVYNSIGQKVITLLNQMMEKGAHNITFDGQGLASGMYILRMTSGSFSHTIKMNLLK